MATEHFASFSRGLQALDREGLGHVVGGGAPCPPASIPQLLSVFGGRILKAGLLQPCRALCVRLHEVVCSSVKHLRFYEILALSAEAVCTLLTPQPQAVSGVARGAVRAVGQGTSTPLTVCSLRQAIRPSSPAPPPPSPAGTPVPISVPGSACLECTPCVWLSSLSVCPHGSV